MIPTKLVITFKNVCIHGVLVGHHQSQASFFLSLLAPPFSEACVNSHQMKLQQGQSRQHFHQNPRLLTGNGSPPCGDLLLMWPYRSPSLRIQNPTPIKTTCTRQNGYKRNQPVFNWPRQLGILNISMTFGAWSIVAWQSSCCTFQERICFKLEEFLSHFRFTNLKVPRGWDELSVDVNMWSCFFIIGGIVA